MSVEQASGRSAAVSADEHATTPPCSADEHATTPGAALAAVTAAVDALAAATGPSSPVGRPEGPVAADVLRESMRLAGRLSAIAARMVPVVEADGWWALDGARSITTWVAAQGRVTHGQASHVVRLGRAFRDELAATATDTVAGSVPLEAAHAMAAAANTTERRAALAAPAQECGEGFLRDLAATLPVGQFRVLTRRWAAQADPAADDRGYREASDREFLTLAQSTDGCHLAGFLTTEHGHALAAALAAVTPRSTDLAGEPAPRRRARALVNLTRLVLDADLTGATGTHRPQITAVVDLGTLHRALDRAPGSRAGTTTDRWGTDRPRATDRTEPEEEAITPPADGEVSTAPPAHGLATNTPRPHGYAAVREPVAASDDPAAVRHRPEADDVERFAVAELVGTGPIPDQVLARLACDSAITRVVFGPQSQVLNVGRAERTYTGAKRRAIIARDQHCRYPGCDAPPALGEIHHTEHWHRDHGETDTRTGILLCWHHHSHVHDRAIEIARDAAGRWQFTDRHGQRLRT